MEKMYIKDFERMVKTQGLEVISSVEMNSFAKESHEEIKKSIEDKDLLQHLAATEIRSFKPIEVTDDQLKKSIMFVRQSQIAWDEPTDDIQKSRDGVFLNTPLNKELDRIGIRKSEYDYIEKGRKPAPAGTVDKYGYVKQTDGSWKKPKGDKKGVKEEFTPIGPEAIVFDHKGAPHFKGNGKIHNLKLFYKDFKEAESNGVDNEEIREILAEKYFNDADKSTLDMVGELILEGDDKFSNDKFSGDYEKEEPKGEVEYTFKPMSKSDWNGFSGAEKDAVINYTEESTAIYSKEQGYVQIILGGQGMVYGSHVDFNVKDAKEAEMAHKLFDKAVKESPLLANIVAEEMSQDDLEEAIPSIERQLAEIAHGIKKELKGKSNPEIIGQGQDVSYATLKMHFTPEDVEKMDDMSVGDSGEFTDYQGNEVFVSRESNNKWYMGNVKSDIEEKKSGSKLEDLEAQHASLLKQTKEAHEKNVSKITKSWKDRWGLGDDIDIKVNTSGINFAVDKWSERIRIYAPEKFSWQDQKDGKPITNEIKDISISNVSMEELINFPSLGKAVRAVTAAISNPATLEELKMDIISSINSYRESYSTGKLPTELRKVSQQIEEIKKVKEAGEKTAYVNSKLNELKSSRGIMISDHKDKLHGSKLIPNGTVGAKIVGETPTKYKVVNSWKMQDGSLKWASNPSLVDKKVAEQELWVSK